MDADGAVFSSVQLTFSANDVGGNDWALVGATLRVAALDIQSDLGSSGKVRITTLGDVHLVPETQVLAGEAPPATYSQAELELDGSSAAAFELIFQRASGQRLVVRSDEDATIDVRCESPVSSDPATMLGLSFVLDASALVAAIDGASIPAAAGMSYVDRSSNASLVSTLGSALADGLTLACDAD